MFQFLVIVFLPQLLFERETLPDYESYASIFVNPLLHKNMSHVFAIFLDTFSTIANYETFRLFIFILGCLLFFPKLVKRSKNLPVLLFVILIVILEFYMVRLRAGMSIFLFYVGYQFFYREWRLIAISIVGISFMMHPATCMTLLLVYLPIFISSNSKSIKIVILLTVWIGYLLIVEMLAINRGSHLFSDINPFRILGLVVCPILLFLVLRRFRFALLFDDRKVELTSLALASMSVVILYVFGYFELSGEAIVRIYSLVVGPALLFGFVRNSNFWTRSERIWGLSALTVNSLFFLNIVYL